MLQAALALGLSLCGSAYAAPPMNALGSNPVPATAKLAETGLIAPWAVILNPNLPLIQRQHALAAVEHKALRGDVFELYMLGSLYHMGEYGRSALVRKNLVKASLYLGNAAVRGSVLAMAKMAEIKYATHDYREAMNWAQIYAHYASLLPRGRRPHDGYVAELVKRILDKLGQSAMPSIMRDADSFMALHDATIRTYAAHQRRNDIVLRGRRSVPFLTAEGQLAPRAGFADYLLGFKPDGSLSQVWLLDAVPDPQLGLALQRTVDQTRASAVAATSGESSTRYAWLPVIYDDGRYRVALQR
ncbi:MAG: hypothetical protein EPN74_10350 [Rhodanobacter sp.]|nr:MAG: hypothetical protein EPN74_10350 [Rhodanobacter sp.]